MKRADKRRLVCELARAATESLDTKTAAQKMDIFEGIGVASAGLDNKLSKLAFLAADHLREAEQHQLLIKGILTP